MLYLFIEGLGGGKKLYKPRVRKISCHVLIKRPWPFLKGRYKSNCVSEKTHRRLGASQSRFGGSLLAIGDDLGSMGW